MGLPKQGGEAQPILAHADISIDAVPLAVLDTLNVRLMAQVRRQPEESDTAEAVFLHY